MEVQKGLTSLRSQKPLKKFEGKWQKILLWALTDQRERERTFWKSLNSDKHVKNLCFKKLSERFSIDRKLDSIDQKLHSINPTAIEPSRFKPKF